MRSDPARPGLGILILCLLCSEASASEPASTPWQIPQPDLASQRLYRVVYDDPDGGGRFRLTLRLERPDRYQLAAVDPLGRALWSLEFEGRQGLWLDHRAEAYCAFGDQIELPALPVDPFPLLSLPPLLLGRLPAAPGARPEEAGERLSYRDRESRRWTAILGEGEVRSWTLWEGGEPVVYWQRFDGWGVLSNRRERVQVRWREVVRERLEGSLVPLAVPPGYRPEGCGI